MNIYIDESGSFVNASTVGAWNAVAAFAVPEAARKKLDQLLDQLKRSDRHGGRRETKINNLTEDAYLQFIEKLAELNAVVFCTATDAGLNTKTRILKHQYKQAEEIRKHIEKLRYAGGRQGVLLMASRLEKLSPQLYVQLCCQIDLMFDVVSRVITYFAQHNPGTLREFRWRIDQKNTSRTDFEDAFEKFSPALLQTRSISEPLPMIEGFDYSKMHRYKFKDGKMPGYLKEDYGIEVKEGLNIQKLIRGNIKFLDSQDSLGIQAVDLIVSGIRRCLRKNFLNNKRAAATLGKLMLQAKHNRPPLNLISFADETSLEIETARLVRIMSANSKRMVMRF